VGLYDEKAKAYRALSPFEAKGLPDCVCFLPDGRVDWIEYKAAGGVQSQHQKAFQYQVEKRGGTYRIIRSVAELEAWYRARGLIK